MGYNPKIVIRAISGKGKGMFATSPIRPCEKVIIWRNHFHYDDLNKIDTTDKLIIQWGDDLFSVEEPGKDARYCINHSCDSNARMIDAFIVVARSDIPTREEITIDLLFGKTTKNLSQNGSVNVENQTVVKSLLEKTGKYLCFKKDIKAIFNH